MMDRGLFLKGDSGVGKSTLLLQILGPYWEGAEGYLSQRLLDEAGETKGFRLVPVQSNGRPPEVSAEYKPGMADIFIEKAENGWVKRPEVFAGAGVKALGAAFKRGRECRFCYIDEIGGVELKSEEFMGMLCRVLEGGIFCVGVLKNSKNFQSMRTRVLTASELGPERDRLEERLAGAFGCRIISYAGENEKKAEIERILKERLGCAE